MSNLPSQKNSLSPQQEIQKGRQKHNNVRNISENHRTIPFELGFLFIKRNLQMKFIQMKFRIISVNEILSVLEHFKFRLPFLYILYIL